VQHPSPAGKVHSFQGTMELWLHAGLVPAEHLGALARAAEASGYHGLALSDHAVTPRDVRSAYPYGERPADDAPFPDPWVTIAALAAQTTRLRFMTKVYLAAARHPLVVARAVATAAVLSGDRVALGVGAGWMAEEFAALGVEPALRQERLDEHLAVLRSAWSPGWSEHSGRFYAHPPLRVGPLPARPIPIYGGGEAPAALRRAAAHDGWLGAAYPPERLRALLARLQRARERAGTADRAGFAIVTGLAGAPTVAGCRSLAALGVTGVTVAPWRGAPWTLPVGELVDATRRLGERLAPALEKECTV
jgi:probable F420-dependent oxidoreductase